MVTAALVDNGVSQLHQDLIGKVVKGYNVIDNNNDTADMTGHGTGMAGIIGATINNSVGIAGVMDLVNVMPISLSGILTDTSERAAVDHVIRNKGAKNIKIIFLTFSGLEQRPTFTNKLREADKAGILMIVTAGNTGKNTTIDKRFPCALTEELNGMLCVAATEQVEMKLLHDSSFANYVDIAAPGVDIFAPVKKTHYHDLQGTCAAAAFIAAVAAMIYCIEPGISSTEVKKILKETAKMSLKDATGQTTLPFGRVDADAALAKLIP